MVLFPNKALIQRFETGFIFCQLYTLKAIHARQYLSYKQCIS